ncbi:prlF antitoxin for toxin YhaV [compost metagenome]
MAESDRPAPGLPTGNATTNPAQASEADAVVDSFLAFLAGDIASHPERLQALDAGFVERLHALTDGVALDLEAPLPPDDE